MHFKIITAAAVLAFTAIMAVGTILSADRKTSQAENRSYAELPKAGLYNGDFSEQLRDFTADHFTLRDKWLKLESFIKPQVGENIVNGVYIGEDRLLDSRISEREAYPTAADRINAFAANYDGTVYLTAIPSSSGVYGDTLPSYLLGSPEDQQITGLYDDLSNNIRKIDAYNILKMLKDNYIYYRNDTKWTSYGAYCVYRTVIQKLGFHPTTYDKYTIRHVSDNFRGNLYNRTLYSDTVADMLDIYDYPDGVQIVSCMAADKNGVKNECSFYDMDMLDTGDMYRMYLGENSPVLEIRTSVNNQRKLLVVKDSYADCFIPFLIQHFSRITVLSPESLDGVISDYVDVSDYEQTLILFGIENIGNAEFFNGISE